jgi:hypothetical protein
MSWRAAWIARVLVVSLSVVTLSAQAKWTPPRTPWGDPDFQGVYVNATITPFERPADMAAKATLTAEEAAALEKQRAARPVDQKPGKGQVGAYNDFWMDSGTRVVSTRQTSLVIDPPDGRVPLKPSGEAARDFNNTNADNFERMSPWDRCITRGTPGGLFPAGYNNAYQIIQTPGYVVLFHEMIHSARIIPVNGRPHRPSTVRTMDGDSVGRWEGDTLVVDITNFDGRGWVATNGAAGRIRGVPQSQAFHAVERFRMIDANTLGYEVRIEDPEVYSRPWTVSIPLIRDDSYEIFEYACHEGNSAIPNVLKGARFLEKPGSQP